MKGKDLLGEYYSTETIWLIIYSEKEMEKHLAAKVRPSPGYKNTSKDRATQKAKSQPIEKSITTATQAWAPWISYHPTEDQSEM